MPTDVVMPQMGESIAEGTIVRWIKKVGDSVERDEPLFEISTDKVDAEIPSPVAGVIAEIRAAEGETVPVNSVVAVIGSAVAQPAAAPAAPEPAGPTDDTTSDVGPTDAPGLKTGPTQSDVGPTLRSGDTTSDVGPTFRSGDTTSDVGPTDAPGLKTGPTQSDVGPTLRSGDTTSDVGPTLRSADTTSDVGPTFRSGDTKERSSPLVRRIAKEHNIDISRIRGTGIGGRVTKDDILAFIKDTPPAASGASIPPATAPSPRSAPQAAGRPLPGTSAQMSPMRKKIAEHMILSRRTSAHVHSVFEVNFSRVAQIREGKRAEYERAGAKLTYLSFILKAVVDALRAVPVVNASVEGDTIVYHKDINVGIAVALEWGLIVPVIKSADGKSLLGLSRAVADLATRARSKQLKPEEVSGGTFTITNPGVFGALFGMPIISQPQVAILGIGNVEKRAVVIDDAIAIRPMAYLSIGYDHRIIDGAVADEFLSHVKRSLENYDPANA